MTRGDDGPEVVVHIICLSKKVGACFRKCKMESFCEASTDHARLGASGLEPRFGLQKGTCTTPYMLIGMLHKVRTWSPGSCRCYVWTIHHSCPGIIPWAMVRLLASTPARQSQFSRIRNLRHSRCAEGSRRDHPTVRNTTVIYTHVR